jgi:ABC-type transport system involved in multi-copper enzyme maturation permease subunit
MNKRLFIFETRKFLKEKKNIFIFFLIAFFLGAVFFQTLIQQSELRKKDIRQTVSLYNVTTQSILTLSEGQTLSEEEKNQLKLLSTIADNLNTVVTLKKNDRYIESYPYQTILFKQMLSLEEDHGIALWENKAIIRQLNRLNVLQEQKINESFDEKGTTGFLFLLTFLKNSFSLFGMFVWVLLFMDLWSGEKNNGASLLYILPIKRRDIEYTKLYLAITVSACLLFLTSIFAFLIGTLHSGTGSADFPIVVVSNNQYLVIPLKEYLSKGFLLGALGVIVFICCIKLADTFFSQPSIILSGLLFLLGISFGIAQLIPSNYLPLNLIESWQFLSLHGNSNAFIIAIIIQLATVACLLKLSDTLKKIIIEYEGDRK